MPREITTVGDDFAVVHDGTNVRIYRDLQPGTAHEIDGLELATLPRPPGELLCRFATTNDVHFGEVVCGILDETQPDKGPPMQTGPGQPPHPELMNRAAVAEMQTIDPAAVVVKGDLTATGTLAEYEAFLACYGSFGERLHHVRGNHDALSGQVYAAGPRRIDLPGVTIALLDTVIPGRDSGTLDEAQLEWLDTLTVEARAPVLVMSHHYPWCPDAHTRPDTYFGIHPDASEQLVAVAARRPAILGTFAGHSHRNRLRHFSATGALPHVEVGCTKDFPGSWVEYRVFEAGILHLHHRVSNPEALAWTERCRGLYADFGIDYPTFALGALHDRCFPVWPR